jgi:hypothetical protein
MTAMTNSKAMQDWLATRPASVQKLAAEFPPRTILIVKGITMHVMGWTEGDDLLVSPVDPYFDYDRAYATRQRLCASHARSGEIKPAPPA